MSHPSSSVGQTPARKGQISQLNPGLQICIMVSFFWGYNPKSPVIEQSRFAESVKEYIGKRFRVWLNPMDILKYYNNIPLALQKAGYPHEWNEDMLGICIAELIQNSQEYDEMTQLSLDLHKELSKEALNYIGPARTNMYLDGRKDRVQAVWAARVSKIKEEKKRISKIPSRDTDPGLRPKYLESDTFPGTLTEILSLEAEMYLNSPEDRQN